MKKHPNPFRDCKNTMDVMKVIRTKCEDLRGKPFRKFIITTPFISGGELCFKIEADYTRVRQKGNSYDDTVGWLDVLLGERYYLFPRNTKLGKYRGEPFEGYLGSGGGGGNGQTNWSSVRIELKHIPHIKKLHEQNEKRAAKAKEIRDKPYPYTDADRAVQKAASDLDRKVMEWREKNYRDYVAKYPQHTLRTGEARPDRLP